MREFKDAKDIIVYNYQQPSLGDRIEQAGIKIESNVITKTDDLKWVLSLQNIRYYLNVNNIFKYD